ncbi:predicted protein [Postia placenta Mad-698-R]|uniref:Uncharacterized protein n=1 Tax=Postia placenta MAD-698-R-SB12 TaxID=670580 RepID=A0A1X6N1E7_9APHY|nr:hypothetical protein POSPLADRAFT_1143305 [Postia placenta MAD-698-R-SB12]EED82546.1 predicted protein [Postia placenta Mad-698-R]OSX62286.1 hypothetical protein POSPLADRAFT_1143305 [Postia placenta MAD-698-R-SB12]
MTSNTGNTGGNTGGGNTGGGNSLGQTIKGTAEIVHGERNIVWDRQWPEMLNMRAGLSEKFRGSVLNAVDGGNANDTQDVAARGHVETQQGIARLQGGGDGQANTAPGVGPGTGAAAGAYPAGQAVGGGSAGVGTSTANTGNYAPSGAAGAGGAPAMSASAGRGPGAALPQGHYQGRHPLQGGAVGGDRGVGTQVNRNGQESQERYGGGQDQRLPQQGTAGPPAMTTNSGPGAGVSSGRPRG